MADRLPRVQQSSPHPPMPVQLPENATGGPFFICRTRWNKNKNKFACTAEARDWMKQQNIKEQCKNGIEARLLWLDHLQGFTGILKYSGKELRLQGSGFKDWVEDVPRLDEKEIVDIWSYTLPQSRVFVLGRPPAAAE